MISEIIRLNESYPNATLTTFVHEEASEPRTAVIVCPGGAYFSLAEREADPIAKFYYNQGFNAYVLRYSISPAPMRYNPLIELSFAIKFVRENAPDFKKALEIKKEELNKNFEKISKFLDYKPEKIEYSLPWDRSFEIRIKLG